MWDLRWVGSLTVTCSSSFRESPGSSVVRSIDVIETIRKSTKTNRSTIRFSHQSFTNINIILLCVSWTFCCGIDSYLILFFILFDQPHHSLYSFKEAELRYLSRWLNGNCRHIQVKVPCWKENKSSCISSAFFCLFFLWKWPVQAILSATVTVWWNTLMSLISLYIRV